MEVVIVRDAKEIGGVAADAIGPLLSRKPEAAHRFQLAGYYRETYRAKPDWQGT